MLTILTDVRVVCLSVCLSVTRLKSAAVRAVYAACRVRGVIWCSLCQITLTTCYILYRTGRRLACLLVQFYF